MKSKTHKKQSGSLSSTLPKGARRLWRHSVVLLGMGGVIVALVVAPVQRPSAATEPQNRLRVEVQQQIQALEDEKESRTPAQRKIDSQLVYAIKMQRGESIAAGIPTLEVNVGADDAGRVTVDISADVDDALLGTLKSMGIEFSSVMTQYHTVRAIASLQQLESVASIAAVHFIQPKQEYKLSQRMQRAGIPGPGSGQNAPVASRANQIRQQLLDALTNSVPLPNGALSVGSAASEGDTSHRASTARGTFNVSGAGIKIGVLSDGVTSLAASQATGDLGPVTVLPGQTGSGDEGTAMLEIVHDLAPSAQLFFATADPTITQFAQNIRDLRTAGCDIIVDDVGYFVESAFQDGTPGATNTNGGVVTQAVNDVVANGALYFSAAANAGNKNDNTSTTWEGDFVSGGTLAIVPGGGVVNDFDPAAAVAQADIITLGGGTGVPINLSWSDPLGASNNDYDLFVLNNAGTAVSTSSTNIQSGTQDPYEQVNTNNTTGRRVVIRQKAGAANRFLHLDLNGGRITFNTEGETHGHSAASGCYGVAATPAFSAFSFSLPIRFGPYPSAFSGSNSVETFSSDGPRKIFFDGAGTAITPGDFSSTGGQVLQQPVLTAADGVAVTGVGSFGSPFFGTSAAAPHAAAIAALIKSANPAFTPAQIKTALTTTAIDIETAGTDRDAGFGIVMPYPALQSLGVTGRAFLELGSVAATETCCNGNGLIERGEGASLNVTLNNPGLTNATGITATLASTTSGVTILNGSASYADLAATSGTVTNATPFSFSLATFSAVDVTINFTLTVNYAGGWNSSQVINFTVDTGRKPISTVLDATVAATSLSFPTTATGTQTNLVFPDDPASTCAVPTAFPGTLTSTTPRFDSYTLTNTSASATCVTVSITADKSAVGAIQAVAYTGSFNPATVGTNYLADAGFIAIIFPGYPGIFSFNVPASGTIIVVVVELKSPGNGFPSAVGSTYTLKVAGLPVTAVPTAAPATISGQVLASDGTPLGGVTMRLSGAKATTTITDASGTYKFSDVEIDNFYTVTPALAGYHFSPASRSFSLLTNMIDAAFTASPEAVPLANAIDTNEYFVRQQYLDFLGREPDHGGLEYWTGKLDQCNGDAGCLRASRVEISAAFFQSAESQETGLYIYRMYESALGRRLTYDEFNGDRQQVIGGADLGSSKAAFVSAFVTRAEFLQKYLASTSGDLFVDALLQTLRDSASFDLSSERGNLVSRYNMGRTMNESRGLVLREVADNGPFAAAVYNPAFVLMEYFGYLRRDAEPDGYAFWLNVLNTSEPQNYRGMVCSFLTSAEYQNRFGTVVTRSNAECGH